MQFPMDYDGVMEALAPYYQAGRPLDYFFAMHVCAVLKELPDETFAAIANFSEKHPSFFSSQERDWRKHVVEQLDLSATIEVAIWDLWLRNREAVRATGESYTAWEFAQEFIEQYFKDDSQVDVWTPETLEAARRRIAAGRQAR